jgi:hypothetical protein
MDCCGARDEVEKLCCLGVKRGSFNRVHGDECDVVEDIHLNSLNDCAIKGSVNAVPDGCGGGRKFGSIAFDDEFPFAEGEAFLVLRAFGVGCGWGRRGGLSRGGGLLLLLSGNLGPGALGGSGCRCGYRWGRGRRRRRRRRSWCWLRGRG